MNEADRFARALLPLIEAFCIEVVNEIVEQLVPVDLRLEVHEDGTKPNRRPVHEDKFAGWRHRSEAAQFSMNALRHLTAIDAAFMFMDAPGLILEQWAIDEMGPAVEDVDHLVIKPLEAPALIGGDGEVAVIIQEGIIEID